MKKYKIHVVLDRNTDVSLTLILLSLKVIQYFETI